MLSLPRLTSLSAGGGCACKLPAAQLRELVAGLGPGDDTLLVGPQSADDAAVMTLSDDGTATVLTSDFFGPVVDDPRTWGAIAAANALSDVYAMGGEPRMGINLLAWPREVLPMEVAAEVLAGAQEVCRQARCAVAGGHSITSAEPLFGMAVMGTVLTDELIRVDRAAPGTPLTLTKPLGLGILNAWHHATGHTDAEAIAVMTTLNAQASRAARAVGISAGTDVTGFGLLGHLLSMCRASAVSAVIDVSAVPVLDSALVALAQGHLPGGSRRNAEWVSDHVLVGPDVAPQAMDWLCDAQTSGGLLLAGEIPGHPVIGEIVASDGSAQITLR